MARKSRKAGARAAQITKEPKYNAALYIRLSVADEDSIINQRSLLEEYAASRPELTLKGVFIDNGETGMDFRRPAFVRLVRECEAGRINCIVVKDLSRLGRNFIETGEFLERVFPALGVRMIALGDGYDSLALTNNDRLAAGVRNLVNEMYSRDIGGKISSALRVKRSRGAFIGNHAAYGYIKNESDKNRLEVNPETTGVVRLIFEWKAGGVGIAEICRRLEAENIPAPSKYNYSRGILKRHGNSAWTPRTVARIIKNPVYLGHMKQGEFIVKNTHEAIVSRELFNRANL